MKPITYITRDIERALGVKPSATYHIVTNTCPYSEEIKKQYPDLVTLIPASTKSLGTADLITQYKEIHKPDVSASDLLVFKNTGRVEPVAQGAGWHLLNPKASLADTIENKLTQVEWLGELGKTYLPRHAIVEVKNLTWTKEPFIIQWNHGYTGGGTLLISSEQELQAIKQKFPMRVARRTDFIRGPSFTVNVVVAANKILVGNISYQITGTLPFTDNMFSTVGNDWGLTHSLLNEEEVGYIQEMAHKIGTKMNIAGWRGLFGIDVIRDDDNNKIYLIEINARQPASTTFESFLQEENRRHGVTGITTFEAHLKALQGQTISDDLILINDGAQIIQRITAQTTSIVPQKIADLNSNGYITISYANTMIKEDLLRIQSMQGIMETHTKFNARGKKILDILS
ncbi:MAG: ATP-grasp domain-containing protein [Candidatus Taylorbacteria bacterium]